MKKRKDGLYRKSTTIGGKRIYFYGKSEREINKKIAEYNAKQSQHLFKDVAELWARKHSEEVGVKCWKNYKPHLSDIVATHGNKDITEITALDVQTDIQKAKSQGSSATIISTRRSIYRMILDYALFNQWIPYNPAASVRMPKGIKRTTREAPEDDVIKLVIENADKPFGLYPLFLLCTGMRKSEVLCLTWDDIKEDHIVVNKSLDYVVHSHPVVKSPKSDAGNRIVPLIDPLKSALLAQMPINKSDIIFLPTITNRSRSPNVSSYLTQHQFDTAWKNYCRSIGMINDDGRPLLTAHQLRHAFATLGFEAGVDEKTMQTMLGHSSSTVTREIYQHLRNKKRALSENKLKRNFKRLSLQKKRTG